MGFTSERGTRRTLLFLFFLSGACGLVYEVVWMRMLTLVFGATAFATSAILASFFSGLALGSLYFGRRVDRGRNPLVLYALLEAGIGVFAFLMPVLFGGLTDLYVVIARTFDLGFYPLSTIRLILAFLVLLVPTTLMGGTLPVMVKFLVRRKDRLGLRVGQLYAINTFGAVVGTMGAGFFLILFLGVREAAYLAGGVNLLIAAAAWALSRAVEREPVPAEAEPAAVPAAGVPSGPPPVSPGAARLALWAVGLSGLAALALEVLWTRSLIFFLDNSTHAFTTVLTAFLLGIGIGSALVARFLDRRIDLVATFGVVQVLIGLTAVMAIPILSHASPVVASLEGLNMDAALLWKWTGLRFATNLSVMLLPTVLMGMTVPLAAKICTDRIDRVGTSLGRVYSMNTIGGVVGSLLAGFVIVPAFGLHHGILAVSAFSMIIGVTLILARWATAPAGNGRGRTLARVGLAAAVAVIVLAAVHIPHNDQLELASYRERADGVEVLSYHEGIGSTVKVFREEDGDRLLSIDGFPVAGTTLGMQDAQKSLGNLPMLLSPVDSPRVNLIGFGAGGASSEVMAYAPERVDCVELVPGVVQAASWFEDVNNRVLEHPRYNLIIDDGRNYVLRTERTYDVIAIDATSPKMVGNGSLYTLEFYEMIRDRLNDRGVAVQWLPFHLLPDSELRMSARTFMEAFPHTTLWLSPLRHHGLLVGTFEPLRIDYQQLRRKMARPEVHAQLEPMGASQPMDFLGWFVMGEDELRDYARGARLNTDNHPYLEFTPAWSYFLALSYFTDALDTYRRLREPVTPLLTNLGRAPAAVEDSIATRFRATQHSIRGDILFFLGRRDVAREEYMRALEIDPEDRNAIHAMWRVSE